MQSGSGRQVRLGRSIYTSGTNLCLSCSPNSVLVATKADVIVGKTAPLPDDPTGAAQRFSKKDVSSALRHSESGVVDQVILTTNAEGQRFVKLRVHPRAVCCEVLSKVVRFSCT